MRVFIVWNDGGEESASNVSDVHEGDHGFSIQQENGDQIHVNRTQNLRYVQVLNDAPDPE